MNKLVSILLILTLSGPSLRTFMVFTDYQINRADMTNKLCENVETDDNCKATCHLVKEVKKESPQSEDFPFVPNKNTKNELLYFENVKLSNLNPESISSISDNYQLRCFSEHIQGVFHPPKTSIA